MPCLCGANGGDYTWLHASVSLHIRISAQARGRQRGAAQGFEGEAVACRLPPAASAPAQPSSQPAWSRHSVQPAQQYVNPSVKSIQPVSPARSVTVPASSWAANRGPPNRQPASQPAGQQSGGQSVNQSHNQSINESSNNSALSHQPGKQHHNMARRPMRQGDCAGGPSKGPTSAPPPPPLNARLWRQPASAHQSWRVVRGALTH